MCPFSHGPGFDGLAHFTPEPGTSFFPASPSRFRRCAIDSPFLIGSGTTHGVAVSPGAGAWPTSHWPRDLVVTRSTMWLCASAVKSNTLPTADGSAIALKPGWRCTSLYPDAFSVSGAHIPLVVTTSPAKNSGWISRSTCASSRRSSTSGIHASLLVTNPSVPSGVGTADRPVVIEPGTRSRPPTWPSGRPSSGGVRYCLTCFDTSLPSGPKTSAMFETSGEVASYAYPRDGSSGSPSICTFAAFCSSHGCCGGCSSFAQTTCQLCAMSTPASSHTWYFAAISENVSTAVRPNVSVNDSARSRTCGTRAATVGYFWA